MGFKMWGKNETKNPVGILQFWLGGIIISWEERMRLRKMKRISGVSYLIYYIQYLKYSVICRCMYGFGRKRVRDIHILDLFAYIVII